LVVPTCHRLFLNEPACPQSYKLRKDLGLFAEPPEGHGSLSRSNLEYLLDAVKDIGERLPRRQALVKKAAFLLFNIISIHPFLNGNKRTAFGLAGSFLEANGFELVSRAKDAYEFLLRIASGEASEEEVERWIASHLTETRRKA